MIYNCLLNAFELWMCYKIFCSGLCWVLNKICRFKCVNNTKIETVFRKNTILGLGSYQNRGKKAICGLGSNQNRGQKMIKFFNNLKINGTYGFNCR